MSGGRIRKASWVGAVALIALLGATVIAKEPAAQGLAPVIQAVLRCRGIADDKARLACFDAAVDSLRQAESSGDLVAVDREQRRAVRRQTFGLTLPALAIFDRGEPASESSRIEVKIASARREGSGRWIVTLEDGAVWRQVDDVEIDPPPAPGSTAIISRGALSSYFLKIVGSGAMRATRDR